MEDLWRRVEDGDWDAFPALQKLLLRSGEDIEPLLEQWVKTLSVELNNRDLTLNLHSTINFFSDLSQRASPSVEWVPFQHALSNLLRRMVRDNRTRRIDEVFSSTKSEIVNTLVAMGVINVGFDGNVGPGPSFPIIPGREDVFAVIQRYSRYKRVEDL